MKLTIAIIPILTFFFKFLPNNFFFILCYFSFNSKNITGRQNWQLEYTIHLLEFRYSLNSQSTIISLQTETCILQENLKTLSCVKMKWHCWLKLTTLKSINIIESLYLTVLFDLPVSLFHVYTKVKYTCYTCHVDLHDTESS